MSAGLPYEILEDCPHCLTESAALCLFDPAHPASTPGTPIDRRCRMCGAHQVLIVDEAGHPNLFSHTPPSDLTSLEAAHFALERWSKEEGEPDVDLFCRANLSGSLPEIVAMLGQRQPIATNFDVIQYLFPATATASNVSKAAEVVPRPPPKLEPTPPIRPEPRTIARLLASVIAADGRIRKDELAYAQKFLRMEGHAELLPSEIRIWRSAELPPPNDREARFRAIQAAIELAHLNGETDESEWNVIHDFARSWGIPEEQMVDWNRTYEKRHASLFKGVLAQLTAMIRLH